MKFCFFACALALITQSASATTVYRSVEEFENLAGTPSLSIDFSTLILPSCADADYFRVHAEVIGNSCVASSSIINGKRVYTMRGHVWSPNLNIRSGDANGAGPEGLGTGYSAHLWGGPGTFLSPDPLGGTHLAIEPYRPVMSLGVTTTSGFFGWLAAPEQALSDQGLLVLPEGAQITKLEFDYLQPVPEPTTLALACAGALLLVAKRAVLRATRKPPKI